MSRPSSTQAKSSAPKLDPGRIVEARFAAGATKPDQIPAAMGLELAFVGRSNVGKSSLMNALCQRRNLVRTSSTPGCTRQISFFEVRTADGAQLTLVDLPGYGFAKRSKTERRQWADLIEGYLLTRPTLTAVAALVDLRRGLQGDDVQLLELLSQPPQVVRPPLALVSVGTKLDKVPPGERFNAVQELRRQVQHRAVGVSVQLPDTCADLWRELRAASGLVLTRHTAEVDPNSAEET